MEESCMTCDNGDGVGGCAYPICCIQFSEWKPIPVKMEWQPIETAPKDGAKILAYADGSMTVVYWLECGDNWELAESGSWAESGEWEPTHWMPLPLPPAGSP